MLPVYFDDRRWISRDVDYWNLVVLYVQKMNLTAVKEENEVMERHVEDSLAIIKPVRDLYASNCRSSFEDLNVVDVGSGAGLPGLILAIACPSIDHDLEFIVVYFSFLELIFFVA